MLNIDSLYVCARLYFRVLQIKDFYWPNEGVGNRNSMMHGLQDYSGEKYFPARPHPALRLSSSPTTYLSCRNL